jgi:hypothetical protein
MNGDLVRRLDAEFAAIEARATGLAGPLPDAALAWRPAPGAWSIAECLEHLTLANRVGVAALERTLERARQAPPPDRPFRPRPITRLFLMGVEPPARIRVRAPDYARPPAGTDRGTVLSGFGDALAALRRTIAEAGPFDWRTPGGRHPLGTRLTLGEWLCFHAAHNRRHLWQAERVARSRGFPGPR